MILLRSLPLLVLLCSSESATADPAKPVAPPPALDSGPVLEILRSDITSKPSRVLIAVEDALTMNEQAACEIVREAIILTRADPKLVGDIVFTALKCAPAMTAVIVECAVRRAPEAVDQIRAAMKRALGDEAGIAATPESGAAEPASEAAGEPAPPADESSGKNTAGTGKGTGKTMDDAPPEEDETGDFSLSKWVGVGGIYLKVPSGSGQWFCAPDDPCCSTELTTSCLRP